MLDSKANQTRYKPQYGGNCVAPRVLLVGPSVSGGGAENRFLQLRRHLFKGQADAVALTIADVQTLGSDVNRVMNMGWKSQWSYPRIIYRLRCLIHKGDYQAVLAFGFFPNLVAGLATIRLKRAPVLILTEITRPWSESQLTPQWWRRLLFIALPRRVYAAAQVFAANSIDGVRESVQYLKVDAARAVRVPNLVDAQALLHAAAKPVPAFALPTIVTVGRLVAMKRIDTVLDALARLPSELNCRLLVLGDGPERPALVERARQLGIASRVEILGWVANPYTYVRRARALVLCSEYEGFSNAVLEAMFLDVPVITSFCSADAGEMCERGAALGFPVGDVSALTQQLIKLLREGSIRRDLISRAAAYRASHELRTGVRVYEQIIEAAVAGTALDGLPEHSL
jgi:glycosyltransferase involved in cell wall biosynthesis